jgi:hypothetical protein
MRPSVGWQCGVGRPAHNRIFRGEQFSALVESRPSMAAASLERMGEVRKTSYFAEGDSVLE